MKTQPLGPLVDMETGPATILVIEDHRATRTFLADNLAADGYELLEAETAAEARHLMETKFPDLAIVDLGLPDQDGLELLRDVRETDRIAGRLDPDLPLLVLTGRAGDLDRLRGFDSGADDYLSKPFSYQELRARVLALLRRSRAAARRRTDPDRPTRARSTVAPRPPPRPTRPALEEGVRAAAGAGGGTDSRFHP